MQPYYNPTRKNMEGYLNIFKIGRLISIVSNLNTTSIFLDGRWPEKVKTI